MEYRFNRGYVHIEHNSPRVLQIVSIILSSGVLFLVGKELFQGFYQELKTRQFSLGTLITLGITSSYLLSVMNFMQNNATQYFETSAMIASFYTGSLLLDAHLKQKVNAFLQGWQVGVPLVQKLGCCSNVVKTPANSVEIGDLLSLEPNEMLPFDANLLNASGDFNQAHLTGEEEPVTIRFGETIQAGSIALQEGLKVRITSLYDSSSLAAYWNHYVAQKQEKGQYEILASKAAKWLITSMSVMSVLTFMLYFFLGDTQTALSNALSVLLISCPCAFSIATPAAIWIAHKKFHENGIILKTGSKAIELLKDINHFVFDKTGTLTETATISEVKAETDLWDFDTMMRMLLSVESDQNHPLAQAVRDYGKSYLNRLLPISDKQSIQGLGIRAHVLLNQEMLQIAVLNHKSDMSNQLKENEFGLFIEDVLALRFHISYPLKNEVLQTFRMLKSNKDVKISILSGDPVPRKELLHSDWTYLAHQSPEDKSAYIKTLTEKGDQVAFVGDGLNDLLAMAQADISIAMYEGVNQNKAEADIVFFNQSFSTLGKVFEQAKRVHKTLVANFIWAVLYNTVGVALAVLGLLNPIISIVAMILSSTFVTLNSLRLTRSWS